MLAPTANNHNSPGSPRGLINFWDIDTLHTDRPVVQKTANIYSEANFASIEGNLDFPGTHNF